MVVGDRHERETTEGEATKVEVAKVEVAKEDGFGWLLWCCCGVVVVGMGMGGHRCYTGARIRCEAQVIHKCDDDDVKHKWYTSAYKVKVCSMASIYTRVQLCDENRNNYLLCC